MLGKVSRLRTAHTAQIVWVRRSSSTNRYTYRGSKATEGQDIVSRFRITRRRVIVAAISTVAAAGIAVAVLAPSSGADFSASDTGSVHVATATLNLSLSDDNNTGTFDANFVNLAPGHANWQAKTFKVKNTGSIPANVKIGGPLSGLTYNVPAAANPAKLKFQVDGYQALTSVASLPSSINLGQLAAGEERTYVLRVELDSTAGNEWQNANLGVTATVTLNQA